MTDAQVAQVAVEVVRTNLAPAAQIAQIAVEALRPNVGPLTKLTAAAGSYALSGKAATFAIRLTVARGTYSCSGIAAGLRRAYTLNAGSAGYVLTGKTAGLVKYVPNKLSAREGSFSLTGQPAQFAILEKALAGSFALTGFTAQFKLAHALPSGHGAYNFAGSAASLGVTAGTIMHAARGSYSISGKDAVLHLNHRWHADVGSYSASYKPIRFLRGRVVKGSVRTLTASGQSAQLRRPKRIFSAGGAAYVVTRQAGYPFQHSSGPFFFAWADAGDATFSAHHRRYDESIFSFSLAHEEGQIPVLELEIKNPQIGLLNASRRQWAWFSWTDGLTVHPQFFGRLVCVPGDLQSEVIRLQFIARANNYLAQKHTVAQELKNGPEYDPLFLDAKSQDDPDAILEGYSAAWHVDRTSLEWTISDIIIPEDGVVIFDPADVFYDSLKIGVGQPPLKSVKVSTNVGWSNTATASKNLGHWVINTYLGDALLNEWPKNGTALGGGWVADNSYCVDFGGVNNAQVIEHTTVFKNGATTHAEGDTMSATVTVGEVVGTAAHKYTLDLKTTQTWGPSSASSSETFLYALQYTIVCGITAQAASDRSFSEDLSINLGADVQGLLFDAAADQETELIEINAGAVAGPDALTHYFATDRGNRSIVYMLMRARARLLTRARAVDVSWQTTFRNGVELSCRMGAELSDPRIPGGTASGKIISYTLAGNGDTGEFITSIKIGVAVGNGSAIVTPDAGIDAYAEDYAAAGYTVRTGVVEAISAAGVGYTPVSDPGHRLSLTDGASGMLMMEYGWLFEKYFVNLTLPDISRQDFSTVYDVSTQLLEVPKGIDLGAAHVAG